MKRIGIIGAGFSGTMTAVQIAKHATSPIHISLIDNNPMARGPAYLEADLSLCLNVRADQMGAYPDQVGHFYEWLSARKYPCAGSDFIPRKIYGDYLNEILERAIVDYPLVKIEKIFDLVIDLDAASKKILLKSGSSVEIDEVVLAMGLTPAKNDFLSIKNSNDPVTIIGTGLSMVDVVIYLHSINYSGVITAVSRRGLTPLPHQFSDSKASIVPGQKRFLETFMTLREDLKKYPWRLVIDALRPHTQSLWSGFTEHERSQFMRYLRPFWDVHRHRISPLHYEILTKLQAEKKLIIKAIGFKPYTPTDTMVINCTGMSLLSNPLIKKLTASKIVEVDSLNLGITSKYSWVHTIGALKRGELWESTAVPELRVQAKHLGQILASSASSAISRP